MYVISYRTYNACTLYLSISSAETNFPECNAAKKWRLCLIHQVFCVDLSGFNFFITKAHVARIFYKSIVGFYSATGLIHVVDKSMAVQKRKLLN